jgi:putative membrane protein
MRTLIASIVLMSAAALASACKSEQPAPAPGKAAPPSSATAPTPPTAPTPSPAKPAGASLTDAQIAAIVVTANQVDIDAGELAVERSANVDVDRFAQQMVTDHGAVNQAAVELVTRLGVTPEESAASKGLAATGAETRARLAGLQGAEFDRAYVDNEVAYHEAVIGVLDKQLIPSATSAELKQTLVGVRPAFAAHLAHARHLQAALAGSHAATR